MFRRRSMIGFLGMLFLVLLLVAGGVGLYRSGFANGITAGAVAAGGGSENGLPEGLVYPWAYGYLPYGFHRGPSLFGIFFGLLFFGGLALVLTGMVSRMFFFRRWKPGPGGYGPHPGWHKMHPRGPRGSWVWQPDQPEETPEASDDADTPKETA